MKIKAVKVHTPMNTRQKITKKRVVKLASCIDIQRMFKKFSP
ncbi:MAG TPA: hypothetical protein VM077_00880 [Candidatus Limnocylindrales bacterium]|nr:hypothetical protein [Candidatus Limnocylindrales bacterium]